MLILGILLTWFVLSVPLGLLVGRFIALGSGDAPLPASFNRASVDSACSPRVHDCVPSVADFAIMTRNS